MLQSFIRTADIIVVLISADFFASDQCFEVEMPCVLEQYSARAAHVLTVLLRPTAWIGFPLAQHALLPPNGKAVSVWENLDSALTEVAKGIYRVVEELLHRLTSTYRQVKPPQFPLFTLPTDKIRFSPIEKTRLQHCTTISLRSRLHIHERKHSPAWAKHSLL